ncbi:hypothetical protein KVT40_004781 [Elsinoe batatas]|uniref:Tautomerase cis-CaaD-like domain-containing protein n=1 Tax=Elsinoe batatas TaxID=2601811 RepID=A0A8K0PHC0_9PEZI|nr:hypothetical protein KVT40_004781 [Elsinoe batatas]
MEHTFEDEASKQAFSADVTLIDHIAAKIDNVEEQYRDVCYAVSAIAKPHIIDKGWNWEFHVDETERRMWQINGYFPPPSGSEQEKLWERENKTVPYEGMTPRFVEMSPSHQQFEVNLRLPSYGHVLAFWA